mmetsp:Transcript_14307/g.27898  ORF Transcript_14307/g.27898 Transcript_14307/m.27898 type:complete len:203 (-) Transcript_14307:137-745(-)
MPKIAFLLAAPTPPAPQHVLLPPKSASQHVVVAVAVPLLLLPALLPLMPLPLRVKQLKPHAPPAKLLVPHCPRFKIPVTQPALRPTPLCAKPAPAPTPPTAFPSVSPPSLSWPPLSFVKSLPDFRLAIGSSIPRSHCAFLRRVHFSLWTTCICFFSVTHQHRTVHSLSFSILKCDSVDSGCFILLLLFFKNFKFLITASCQQ